ncbi:MAG: SDR family NAD(P)-dependent oxidoreductase [Hyphomicrobiaceae bacterium]
MDIDFAGQHVLVTGAARGIGRAIVQGFAARGARVHAADILNDGLAELASHVVCQNGGSLATHAVDLADSAAVAALVAGINGGRIDVLVHAAGGVRGQAPRPIDDVTDADWHAIMDGNLTAAFKLVRAAAPAMKAANKGRIVFISSGAGLGVSLTGIQAYATAKAAEIGFTRQMASELGRHNITVNSVAPGFMPTSPDYVRQWQSYTSERQAQIVDGIAMKRIGVPEDIAHAVMFLASTYAGFISGQTISVRGGP